jgi:hypothetical protein
MITNGYGWEIVSCKWAPNDHSFRTSYCSLKSVSNCFLCGRSSTFCNTRYIYTRIRWVVSVYRYHGYIKHIFSYWYYPACRGGTFKIYIRQDNYNELIMTSETPRIGWKLPILVGYQDANLPRWCYNVGVWSDVHEVNNLDTQPTT